MRLTVLEALYTHRRNEAREPGLFDRDLETMVGRPLEQLEFTFWYLLQRSLVKRGEQSRLIITVEGVDYLEQHYELNTKRRLNEHAEVRLNALPGTSTAPRRRSTALPGAARLTSGPLS